MTAWTARRAAGVVGIALGALLLLAWLALAVSQETRYQWARAPFSLESLATLAMAMLLLVVGARLARGPRAVSPVADAAPPEQVVVPRTVQPVPVPPPVTEEEDLPVSACLRCGSTEIAAATLGDGLFPGGESLEWICRRCNYRGQPLNFDTTTGYRRFVMGLHESG